MKKTIEWYIKESERELEKVKERDLIEACTFGKTSIENYGKYRELKGKIEVLREISEGEKK